MRQRTRQRAVIILSGSGPGWASSIMNLFIFIDLISSSLNQKRDFLMINLLFSPFLLLCDNDLWQRAVFAWFIMITLIHRSGFLESGPASSFMKLFHFPLARRFLTRVPRRQRQHGRTSDKLWEKIYYLVLVHHFHRPVPRLFYPSPVLLGRGSYILFINKGIHWHTSISPMFSGLDMNFLTGSIATNNDFAIL